MLTLLHILASGGGGTIVSLSGESISGTTSAEHGIIIRTDGTIDKQENGVTSQIDAATDWIIPNVAAATDYEFRVTNVVWTQGSTFSTSPGANGTWFDLTGGDLSWFVQDTVSTALGIQNVTFDLEVRKASGSTLSSASYTLVADYEI